MAVIRKTNITKYWGWDVAEEMSALLHMICKQTGNSKKHQRQKIISFKFLKDPEEVW